MLPIYAFAIMMAVFAFGELVAQKTKAMLSTTLVIAITLLIMFWNGLPKDIFQTAGVTNIGLIMFGIIITSMGTMMDIPELKRQWKTVIISLCGVTLGVGMILLIGRFCIGKEMSIAGAPIFAGANVAVLMMQNALTAKGLDNLNTFVILILVTQNFVGIPIASFLLKKEAINFVKDKNNITQYATIAQQNTVQKRRPLELPAYLNRPSIVLTKIALVAAFSQFLSKFLSNLTNEDINYFVIALIMGIIMSELGFLEKNVLTKSESSGFIIFVITIVIFSTLARTTPQMLLSMIFPLIITLVLGTVGVIISGIITGKILKVSACLAIAMGLSCTFGFPTTMLMPKEVAEAVGQNKEEETALVNYLMPKMITAGFITVTIASVLIAGTAIKLL